MTLELKKFNMREQAFKPNENKGPVIVMIGRRDTGKSFLVRDLLQILSRYSNRHCYVRNRSWKRFPIRNTYLNCFIHDEYNNSINREYIAATEDSNETSKTGNDTITLQSNKDRSKSICNIR